MMACRNRPRPQDLRALWRLTSCHQSVRTFCVDQGLLQSFSWGPSRATAIGEDVCDDVESGGAHGVPIRKGELGGCGCGDTRTELAPAKGSEVRGLKGVKSDKGAVRRAEGACLPGTAAGAEVSASLGVPGSRNEHEGDGVQVTAFKRRRLDEDVAEGMGSRHTRSRVSGDDGEDASVVGAPFGRKSEETGLTAGPSRVRGAEREAQDARKAVEDAKASAMADQLVGFWLKWLDEGMVAGNGYQEWPPPFRCYEIPWQREIQEELACQQDHSGIRTHDPLQTLGVDILYLILSHLNAHSLARCSVLSKGWRKVALDDYLWRPKCERLWIGKAHLPRAAMLDGLPKAAVYSKSVQDSRRVDITQEDLCDHEWSFRFKNCAPAYWLNRDPSWRGGGSPMKRFFHRDWSHTAGADDLVWGGHESNYTLIEGTAEDGTASHRYVRINHWPELSVVRRKDWGWQLSNRFFLYQSVPDFWKAGGTGPT